MTPISQALSAALLHFVWQGLLAAILLWIALFLMKNRSANARYLVSCLALSAQAILPAVTAWALYHAPSSPGGSAGLTPAAWPAAASALPRAAAASLPALQSWALPVWAAGVLIFSLRLVWGCREVSTLRRAGEPAAASTDIVAGSLCRRMGLQRAVKLVMTTRSDSPSVVGWLRPVVLLPAAALAGLSEEHLECILAHELAHIRRHDYLINLLQNIVETVLFYHPAVWWTSARVRHERELCCDDLAVHVCGDVMRYARSLTALEKTRGAAPSLAMAGTGGSLLYRVRRLMGLPANETAPSRMAAIGALLLGVSCLVLNTNWAKAQEQGVPGILGYAHIQDSPGVQIDLGGAKVLERDGIEYPGSAWEHQIGGIVLAEATLSGDGSVSDARILSGPVELRKAVLQSLLGWHFAAAPAGSTLQVSVNFQWEQAQQGHEKDIRRNVVLRGQNGTVYSFRVPQEEPTAGAVSLLQQTIENAERNNAPAGQLAELRSKLEQEIKMQAELHVYGEQGSRVARIEFSGLTEQQQKQVSERMSVHVGDQLTEAGQLELIRAVSAADPPVSLSLGRDENSRLVIRITPAK